MIICLHTVSWCHVFLSNNKYLHTWFQVCICVCLHFSLLIFKMSSCTLHNCFVWEPELATGPLSKVEQSSEWSSSLPYTSVLTLLKREPWGHLRLMSPNYVCKQMIDVKSWLLYSNTKNCLNVCKKRAQPRLRMLSTKCAYRSYMYKYICVCVCVCVKKICH